MKLCACEERWKGLLEQLKLHLISSNYINKEMRKMGWLCIELAEIVCINRGEHD